MKKFSASIHPLRENRVVIVPASAGPYEGAFFWAEILSIFHVMVLDSAGERSTPPARMDMCSGWDLITTRGRRKEEAIRSALTSRLLGELCERRSQWMFGFIDPACIIRSVALRPVFSLGPVWDQEETVARKGRAGGPDSKVKDYTSYWVNV